MNGSGAPAAVARPATVLPRLFLVQFLSWGAMFCLWVYALPVVERSLGSPGREQDTLLAVSACFSLYAVAAAGLAFAVPPVADRFGTGTVHGAGLLIGAVGLAVLGLAHGGWPLVPAFLLVAFGWTCMANIPYALAAAVAPPGRGARTVRLFGFSTVLPQIVVSTALAVAAPRLFGDAVAPVMLSGAGMMALGGVLTLAWRRHLDVPLGSW